MPWSTYSTAVHPRAVAYWRSSASWFSGSWSSVDAIGSKKVARGGRVFRESHEVLQRLLGWQLSRRAFLALRLQELTYNTEGMVSALFFLMGSESV